MTQPPEPETVAAVTDEEIAFEEWAVALVAGQLAAAVAPIITALLAAGATASLAAALVAVRWRPMAPKIIAVHDAGILRSNVQPTSIPRTFRPVPDPGIDRRTRGKLDAAARAVRDGDAETGAGLASRAVADAEGAARSAANEGLNAGTAVRAARAGLNLLWVPEVNACLHCLAYAGWVVEPNDPFPAGLTFADKPLPRPDSLGPLRWPPLHPNCRCRVRAVDLRPGRPPKDLRDRAVSPAAAVAREARRSVLRGWSGYASNPAALRAAERLLAAGAGLPKTVEARARRDVKRGEFSARHTGNAGPVGSARYS